ncbi:P-loop containing nucleoside triphosphate hydrolase protein [Aulographum hederae CBS 113979]|uniref:DNA 3'-5' helicase n=1 Tax=Aulographum hederae CBS 113979 TaxID=1176131 RepID=A0A6G1GI62_9PEZI|nr:P-loop containing nucleoside triphosphate hydrolase protein [Aulographum hederae CBS 113979]
MALPVLPDALCYLAELRVVLCTEHGSCYTGESLPRHLRDQHGVSVTRRREIFAGLPPLACNAEAVEIRRRIETVRAIEGLPIHAGYACCAVDCGFLTVSRQGIEQHCREAHGRKLGKGRRKEKGAHGSNCADDGAYRLAKLQTLWAKKGQIRYFPVDIQHRRGWQNERQYQEEAQGQEDIWKDIEARFRQAQEKQARTHGGGGLVERHDHISEVTPWLRQTGYHSHLQGLPLDQIADSYRLPHGAAEQEPELAAICSSVDRVLRRSMAVLERDYHGTEEKRQLSRLNSKLLNTFRGAEMSQDPIKPLQNSRSKQTYIRSWQKLACYYYRVTQDGYLRVGNKLPFLPNTRQRVAFEDMWKAAEKLDEEEQRRQGGREEELGKEEEEEGGEEEADSTEELSHELDQTVLRFSLALIQHRLDVRAFDSVMVSFAAVLAWDPASKTWMQVGNYTSYLSQLIYDCQLLVLQHSLQLVDSGKAQDLTACITNVRDSWLRNDTPGPVAELLGTRLLGFEIARNTVNQAQVRWHADGETIVYQEVQLRMEQLRELVSHEVQAARKVLEQDLCFGAGESDGEAEDDGERMPRYDLRRLLAVGIAIKKFSGSQGFQFDLDLPGEGDGEGDEASRTQGAGSMPDVFHWQASHKPATGNAMYGGTVNFGQGLTDAGIQDYRLCSQMWHSLCRDPAPTQGRKHARQESTQGASGDGNGLVKRLAFRRGSHRGCRRIWSMEEALTVLKQMHGPGAVYKDKQADAIRAVISNRQEVVVVLKTGEGKSLLYQLPAMLPGAGTTILIVPLVALKQDTIRRCAQLGVECTVWHCNQSPSPGCPLVVVSLDQAVQTTFFTYANQLDAAGTLARVVLDESHLVCTAESYRSRMREVKQLRILRCQFVFLTGTLPPQMQGPFESALLLQRPLYTRSITTRIDLRYFVVEADPTPPGPTSGGSLEAYAASAIENVMQGEHYTAKGSKDRVLIFVRTRSQADFLAVRLGCSRYYSNSGREDEKAEVIRQWIRGESQILVATSALAGLDYPHVRIVFHVGEPSGGVIDFAQNVGRAGRDREGGYSVVFLPIGWQAGYTKEGGDLLPENTKAMQRFLDKPRCRMIPLSMFLDGQAQSCKNEATACDRCLELGLIPIGTAKDGRVEARSLSMGAQKCVDGSMRERSLPLAAGYAGYLAI